ncbi:MAG: MFS transporter [Nanoarchaeota archaeon]|nr:MFS transporter [Nanoarchaeota archaeon]
MLFQIKNLKLNTIQQLLISSFLVSFGIVALGIVGTLYLSHLGFSSSTIGYILAAVIFINIIFNLFISSVLERFNEYKLYLFQIISLCILYLLVFFIENVYFFILVLIAGLILVNLGDNAFGIVFRDLSKEEEFDNNESLLYGISNISWFLGSMLIGFFLDIFEFKYVFLLLSLIFFFSLVYSLQIKIKLKRKKRKKIDSNPMLNIKDFFKNNKLFNSYLFNFTCYFHYSFLFVFVLLEIEKNFGILYGGLFISAILFPLMFIQINMNYFIKKIKVIKLLYFSFILLAMLYLLAFIVSFNFLFIVVILILTALPIAFIEPLKEVYFFKHTTQIEEEKFYPLFLTGKDIGSLFSKLIISSTLLFIPFKFISLIIFLLILFVIFKIHKDL